VTTTDAGPQTIPVTRQGPIPELNTTHTGTGSLWLTASATDSQAGIKSVTLTMNAAGCSAVDGHWMSPGTDSMNNPMSVSGVTLATFTGTETGAYPNQQVNPTGTASFVFDVSNYLNGACSGQCVTGSGTAARSTLNAQGTPCCANFVGDQVDFEFWATACNFSGACGSTNLVQYVGFSGAGLQSDAGTGSCVGGWISRDIPVGPVTSVPPCTGH
jgi:hypothetical protein